MIAELWGPDNSYCFSCSVFVSKNYFYKYRCNFIKINKL